MRKLILLIGLCAYLPVCAQTFHLNGTCVGENFKKVKLYVKPMEDAKGKLIELDFDGTQFKGDVPVASDGFYNLVAAGADLQMQLPFYLSDTASKKPLNLTIKEGGMQNELDADNKALSAFSLSMYKDGRYFWMNGKDMKPEQVLPFLKGFVVTADSIAAKYQCSEPVKQYLKLWSYTTINSYYQSVQRATGIKQDALPFLLSDLCESPEKVLNVPMAAYFSGTSYTILINLPKGGLEERLDYLRKHYTCAEVRNGVEEGMLGSYISNFDFDKNFDAGLEELSAVTVKFNLPERYMNDFKMRRATIKGTAFPANIVLTDVDGNTMDFSSFKGSYVYIDLWASWCGPCCKEAPYLIKLEQELKNKDVKFLSISLDKNLDAWKKKMKDLGLHGNQWVNQDNNLTSALNVTGIPFFLIYDKEGNLYSYDAPRPSSDEILKLLEGLH